MMVKGMKKLCLCSPVDLVYAYFRIYVRKNGDKAPLWAKTRNPPLFFFPKKSKNKATIFYMQSGYIYLCYYRYH